MTRDQLSLGKVSEMEIEGWICLIVMVSIVVIAVSGAIDTSNKKKAMDGHLDHLVDFTATQKVMGEDGNTGIAIDEKRKKVCLIDHTQQNITTRVFLYRDLLSSEIFEDGAIITRTVRTSQLGGALIGGLALGGVGAIIGGLSGKTQTSGKVNKLDLRLTVNDTKKPLHDVNFLNIPIKKNNILYNEAIQQARHWHGLLEVLIKRADLEDKATNAKNATSVRSESVADELKKLVDLRDAGVLSAQEFEHQKMRLLE